MLAIIISVTVIKFSFTELPRMKSDLLASCSLRLSFIQAKIIRSSVTFIHSFRPSNLDVSLWSLISFLKHVRGG